MCLDEDKQHECPNYPKKQGDKCLECKKVKTI